MLEDGTLQFGEKPKTFMKIDTDPLHVVDTNFVEPVEVLMVDIIDGLNDKQSVLFEQMTTVLLEATEGLKGEQGNAADQMGMLITEATEGLKSECGSFVESLKIMMVGVTEDLKYNKEDRKKIECEGKDEELFEETGAELLKVVFPKPEE